MTEKFYPCQKGDYRNNIFKFKQILMWLIVLYTVSLILKC